MWYSYVLSAFVAAAGPPNTGAALGGVHAFFYLWYGEPTTDGEWRHWNHEILPHWTAETRSRYPHGAGTRFRPPAYIHAPYYPARGPYSSRNATTLRSQFSEMRAHGIDAAVLSWWGRPTLQGTHDTQGVSTDDAVPTVLDAAEAAGLRIAFHLEPYVGRSADSVRDDVAYISTKYGDHPALLRALPPRGRAGGQLQGAAAAAGGLPVYYVYDSYHIDERDWATVLSAGGAASVRGGPADGVFIGLWLEHGHGEALARAGFDGAYTYFASDGFSHGATSRNWQQCARDMRARGLLFVPSVGPGYNDVRIRPWNAHNTKPREGTEYYDRMWRAALGCSPHAVSITSWNEWGEGTQIEAAVPCKVTDVQHAAALAAPTAGNDGGDGDGDAGGGGDGAAGEGQGGEAYEQTLRAIRVGRKYEDYAPGAPTVFLDRTAAWSKAFAEASAEGYAREL